jgi:hypothetical protein
MGATFALSQVFDKKSKSETTAKISSKKGISGVAWQALLVL